jgi:hypothetical protein
VISPPAVATVEVMVIGKDVVVSQAKTNVLGSNTTIKRRIKYKVHLVGFFVFNVIIYLLKFFGTPVKVLFFNKLIHFLYESDIHPSLINHHLLSPPIDEDACSFIPFRLTTTFQRVNRVMTVSFGQ